MKRSAHLVLQVTTASRDMVGWVSASADSGKAARSRTPVLVANLGTTAKSRGAIEPLVRDIPNQRRVAILTIRKNIPDMHGNRFVLARIKLPQGLFITLVGGEQCSEQEMLTVARSCAGVTRAALAQYREVSECLLEIRTLRRQALERAKFLARTEHRLKTPLTVAIGWTHALNEWSNLPTEKRESIKEIMSTSLTSVRCDVESLITEARTQILIADSEMRHFYLDKFLNDCEKRFESLSQKHQFHVSCAPRAQIYNSEDLLTEVLDELAGNAVKYSPNGGRIEITAEFEDDDVVIRVADEGFGVPKGLDVFAPFERGAHVRGIIAGTGLGLHMVKTIIQSLGGSISTNNRPSGGAEFVLRFSREGKLSTLADKKYEKRDAAWHLQPSVSSPS